MPGAADQTTDLRRLIAAAAEGDKTAGERLLPLVYDQLRQLARSRMRLLTPGQTLQATALVHEAYLRVVGSERAGWDSRNHFFAAAANAMRNILVEQARRKATRKHGGGLRRRELQVDQIPIEVPPEQILLVHEAVEQLPSRKAELLKLRYFGGLSLAECGQVLGASLSSIEREWRFVKAWLLRQTRDRSLATP